MEDNENQMATIDTVEQPFNPAMIDNIKRILEMHNKGGKQQTYEIEVDGLDVVQRTSVTEVFDNYKTFVHPTTRKIIVTVYRGVKTPACTKHIFLKEKETPKENLGTVQQNPSTSQPGYLSGTEVKQMMQDMLEKERMSNQILMLQRERDELEKKMKEAEEYMAKLQSGINLLQQEKESKGNVIIDKLVDLAKNPPDWVKLIILKNSKSEQKQLSGTDKKDSAENNSLSESDKRHIAVLRKMEEVLEEHDLHALMIVSDKLIEEPDLIPEVADLLDVELPDKE